jgi:hypothetical protein
MAAAQISPPGKNEDVRLLWRKVAECIEVLNALQNMTVVVEGKVHMQGKLEVTGDSSRVKILDSKEVSN